MCRAGERPAPDVEVVTSIVGAEWLVWFAPRVATAPVWVAAPIRMESTHREGMRAVTSVTDSDGTLFEAWLGGDPRAFELLTRRHFSGVWAVAVSIVGEPDEAEDVCQDALVRAWERRSQCRQPERFRAWLMSIARSVAYNRLDSLRRRRQHTLPPDVATQGSTPQKDAEVADLRRTLERGLATLGAAQREVLVLRDLEGWPHAEIAQHLEISEHMSRRHLSDARKAMRAFLDQTEFGDHGPD